MNPAPARPTTAQQLGVQPSETVTIDARRWKALRRQMLRMVLGWRNTQREARRILDSCRHASGCEGAADPSRPCLASCPDREGRLSALVILGNADEHVMFASALPRKLDNDYSPPARETWDALVAELEVVRAGRDVIADVEEYIAANQGVDVAPAPPADRGEQPLTRLMPAPDEEEEIDLTEEPEADEAPAGPFDPHADAQETSIEGMSRK